MQEKQIEALKKATQYIISLSKDELLSDFGTPESKYIFYYLHQTNQEDIMGYRSEIALSLSDEAVELLNCKMEQADNHIREDIIDMLPIKYDTEDTFIIYDDWIKWYEDYEFVILLTEVMDHCYEHDIGYQFIRLGEDHADVEEHEFYTDEYKPISWSRQINI